MDSSAWQIKSEWPAPIDWDRQIALSLYNFPVGRGEGRGYFEVIHRPEELFPRLRWSAFCGQGLPRQATIACRRQLWPRLQGACTMSSGIVRTVVRGLGLCVVLASCAAICPASSAPAVVPAAEGQSATSRHYNPEVRLRKLHLVRPDLIPYPISYAVYC